jgi:Ulp1 family protease
VFNLDNHNQSGSHWVAFLIDNKNKTIEYYDSVGNLPNKNINAFIKRVQNYLHKNCKATYEILYNKTKHQYENNECGMFAIHFIIKRVLGESFHKISKMVIKDKDMNRFRKIVFRPKAKKGLKSKNQKK